MMKIKQRSSKSVIAEAASSHQIQSNHAPMVAMTMAQSIDSTSPALSAAGGCPFHTVGTATVIATAATSATDNSISSDAAAEAKCPFNFNDQPISEKLQAATDNSTITVELVR